MQEFLFSCLLRLVCGQNVCKMMKSLEIFVSYIYFCNTMKYSLSVMSCILTLFFNSCCFSIFPVKLHFSLMWFISSQTLNKLTLGCMLGQGRAHFIPFLFLEASYLSVLIPNILSGIASCLWLLCKQIWCLLAHLDKNTESFIHDFCFSLILNFCLLYISQIIYVNLSWYFTFLQVLFM